MLIGISGKIGAGKDTLAAMILRLLVDKYPNICQKSFAYNVKLMVSILTNTSIEDNLTQEGKNIYLPEWGYTLGELQQKLGTECIRDKLHTNAWILSLLSNYTENDSYVISDVRFKNEADYIKSKNGILIRINGDPSNIRANSKRNLNHISETDLDNYPNFDHIIENNGTLDDLEKSLINILQHI